MTFKPMYDLESLTEPQRQEYYLSACEYFAVPPELSLLAFIWMEAGEGKRNLVLYAKKGATDIIRGNLGISTTKLTKDVGPGYIAWVAEGQDKSGRIEQAVGSASTEGLKGQALASAVMIAQTRATRRMTLQFVGGGLLDESELHTAVTDISRSQANLASLATLPAPAQPSVAPNTDPGKDITSKRDYPPNSPEFCLETHVAAQNPPKEGVSLQEIAPDRPMIAPIPFSSGSIIPEKAENLVQIESAPAKKHRGRPRKSEINLDSMSPNAVISESQRTATPISVLTPAAELVPAEPKATEQAAHAVAESEPPAQIQTRPSPPPFGSLGTITNVDIAAKPEKPAVKLGMPSEAETKAWRARLFVYTNDILPKGGMVKEEGIIWKVRKYVQVMFPEVEVKNGVARLSNQQWKEFFTLLDDILQKSGSAGLVKVIEDVAGKA